MSKISTTPNATPQTRRDLNGESRSAVGGDTGITSPPIVVKSSIDTLAVSLWVHFEDDSFINLLDGRKAIAQEIDKDVVPFEFNSFDFNVHRSGTRHFPYHLSSGDVHLFFNTRSASGSFPTCKLEVGSLSSWTPGVFDIYSRVVDFIKGYSGDVIKNIVSRVDLCADVVGVSIQDVDLQNQAKWITRTTNFEDHYESSSDSDDIFSGSDFSRHFRHRKLTGVTLGAKNIRLNCYDKVAEMRAKKASHKEDFFHDVWGTSDAPVTRVEFQIRREVLKEFRCDDGFVDSMDDLQGALLSLWRYCVTWSRHTAKEFDYTQKNHQRYGNSEFWDLVSNADFPSNKDYSRVKRQPNLDVDSLIKQASGCLLSACACIGIDITATKCALSIDHILQEAKYLIKRSIVDRFNSDPHDFFIDYRSRQIKGLPALT